MFRNIPTTDTGGIIYLGVYKNKSSHIPLSEVSFDQLAGKNPLGIAGYILTNVLKMD